MAFKFIAFATLIAAASAGVLHTAPVAYHEAHIAPLTYSHSAPLAYAAPVAKSYAESYDHDYDAHPQYSYSYDVHDSITGDAKNQHETRNGDAVEGSYSFIEADGSRRVVHYTADDHNGFNAIVEKQPAHPTHAAPTIYQHASPIVKYAAPVSHATYAAPAYPAHGYSAPILAHSYHH